MMHLQPTHPEEHIVELELNGKLDAVRRAELEEHCRKCYACAAQLSTSNWFEREGRPRPGDEASVDRVVREVMMKAPLAAVSVGRHRKNGRIALAAVAMFLGATAAAAYWQASPTWKQSAPARSVADGNKDGAPHFSRGKASHQSPNPPITKSEHSSESAVGEKGAPASAAPPALGDESPPVPLPRVLRSAGELYQLAQAARREGRLHVAAELYGQLQARHPASREAAASHAWLGRLLLGQGRAAEALRQFDRYLASGGAASEEALAGRARALQSLGRAREESEAWRQLMARFPASIYADQARSRIQSESH